MSKVLNMVGGGGGPAASIFVAGLSETDTVTATNGSKTLTGKWTQIEGMVEAKVPSMTSNTAPSGECIAKSSYDADPDFHIYLAFSGSSVYGKQAHSADGDAQDWWIGYDFGYDVKIKYFEISPQAYNNVTFWQRLAKTLTLQGSNDGSTWNDIQSFTRTDKLAQESGDTRSTLRYTVDNPVTYRMFRVVWTTLTPTNGGYSTCSYVQFVGEKTGLISGHMLSPIRDFGTWTVTATDGINTATQDVLVDVITEYEIEMSLSA